MTNTFLDFTWKRKCFVMVSPNIFVNFEMEQKKHYKMLLSV